MLRRLVAGSRRKVAGGTATSETETYGKVTTITATEVRDERHPGRHRAPPSRAAAASFCLERSYAPRLPGGDLHLPLKSPSRVTLMVPPSAAALPLEHRARLAALLADRAGAHVELCFADSYDTLVASVLSGQVTAAWAPPFASARLETAGAPVVVRAVRRGQATYRAALVARVDSPASADQLKALRAAWVDRQSVGGYLLVAAWLRERGLDPERAFKSQRFLGSYQAALGAVLAGEADVCSCFGPPAAAGDGVQTDLYVPGQAARLRPLVFTGEAPNDGIALAPLTPPSLRQAVEQAFLEAHTDEAGRALLATVFQAERFQRAPPRGYRALYLAVRTLG